MPITLLISRFFRVKPKADVHAYTCRDIDRSSLFTSEEILFFRKFSLTYFSGEADGTIKDNRFSRPGGRTSRKRGRRSRFITISQIKNK